MIVIRPIRNGEVTTLATIFTRAVHEIACRDYSPAQLRAWAPSDIAAFVEQRRAYDAIIAEYNGVMAGFSDLGADGHIDMLFVSPDFRRHGVARALLDHVETSARQAGIARLHARASLTARPVFARAGFTVIKLLVIERAGQQLQTYIMEKRL